MLVDFNSQLEPIYCVRLKHSNSKIIRKH